MPRFDYRCTYCRRIFERFMTFSKPTATCPVCGHQGERYITSTPVHFKGEGFTKSKS